MVDIDKKYLKISEAAEICEVKEHILRYWEKHFPELSPTKRNTRRYYQQKDIAIILEIKRLLMGEKFTLSGAKKIVSETFNSKPVKQSAQSPKTTYSKNSSKLRSPRGRNQLQSDQGMERLFVTESPLKQEDMKDPNLAKATNQAVNKAKKTKNMDSLSMQKQAIIKELKSILKELKA